MQPKEANISSSTQFKAKPLAGPTSSSNPNLEIRERREGICTTHQNIENLDRETVKPRCSQYTGYIASLPSNLFINSKYLWVMDLLAT